MMGNWILPAMIVFLAILAFAGIEVNQYDKHSCIDKSVSLNYTPDQVVLLCKY